MLKQLKHRQDHNLKKEEENKQLREQLQELKRQYAIKEEQEKKIQSVQ